MEKIDSRTFDGMLNRRRHMVLLFSSAMDVGSVLAENALDNLEDKYADVCSFFKSDITEDVELAHQYSVYSVPRILLFTDGKPVADVTGAMSHSVMKAFLSKHISRT